MSRTRQPPKPTVFYKMHSLGNDFLVLDGVTQRLELSAEQIAVWSDRHTGIGFDQLLVVEPPSRSDIDFIYRIYNADGSVAEQCGNGTRAVAMLVQHLQLSKKPILLWESAAGIIETNYRGAQHIETTMTVPVLATPKIPFQPSAATPQPEAGTYTLEAAGVSYPVVPISMGNPHGVMFVTDLNSTDVAEIGRQLTRHPAFPSGANIGFCQVIDRQFMRLRVFERGAGETRACGSGACAAMVAARLSDRVDSRVKISMPGGKLRIAWPRTDAPVTMSGSATLVFRGEL